MKKGRLETKHDEPHQDLPKQMRVIQSYFKDQVFSDYQKGMALRSSLHNACENLASFIQLNRNHIKPKRDEYWISCM